MVHARSPQSGLLLFLALLAWRRFERLRLSMVYTVHDSFYDYKLRNQVMLAIALALFKLDIFYSRAAYDRLPRGWNRLMVDRWQVVQNDADLEYVDCDNAAGSVARSEGKFIVISVERLMMVKELVALLYAFTKSADVDIHLVFVGAGSVESELETHVIALGFEDRVLITGLILRDDLFERCASADVFVSTSYSEGLPVAVMEAMASLCRVILLDIPLHCEFADRADFIPMIPSGDVDEFALENQRYRVLSPEKRFEIGLRYRDVDAALFALPIMHAGIEAVYQDLPRLTYTTGRSR